ncbi:carbohydrate binding domain-containing protein [Streptomyces sp. NPDC058818]|uniref:carbohydrate binding domain-containing protein n=1 Tax=Streptomyces sp. NPDC058818 TaxID=3346640 RepID=UPI00369B3C2A
MATHPTVELKVGDTWTDITSYVRYQDMIEIRRGLSAEASQLSPASCTMTLDNRDGRFSPRNPSGAYYGQIGRNTAIRVSLDGGDPYLSCPGGTSDYASTPDSAGLGITGDLDVRIEVSLDDFPPDSITELAGKWAGGGQFSWVLAIDSEGDEPFLLWSNDGTTQITAGATTSLPAYAGGRIGIRVTMDVDNGAAGRTLTFYTAPSIDGPWTQLGDAVTTAGTTSIFDSPADLRVGGTPAGTPYVDLEGRVYAFELRDGIDGAIVANPDFTVQAVGDTAFDDEAGLTWTLNGNTSIADRKIRFIGEVSTWPVEWDISGKDVVTQIEASGILRRLTQTESPLRSPMYRDYTNPERTGIVAYWPLEEAPGAASFASGIAGHPVMTFTGTPAPSSVDDWKGSEPLPVINDGALTAAVPAYADTGEMAMRFLLKAPDAGVVAETQLFTLYTTGTSKRWEVTVNTAGALRVLAFDNEGSEVLGAPYINFAVNGELNNVLLELVEDGSDVDYRLNLADYTGITLSSETAPALEYSGTLTGYTLGLVSRVTIGRAGGLGDTSIGQVVIANDLTAYTATAAAVVGWRGENPSNRLRRLVENEEGIPLQVISRGTSGNTTTMGVQGLNDLVDLVRECADTDLGILFEPRNEIGIAYRSRLSLYNQTPRLTLDYAQHQLSGPPIPVDDDRYTRNDVTVIREDGTFAKAVQETGPLSVLAPPDGVSRYDESVTISLGEDDQLPSQASWRLHLGTIDEARYPQIELNLRHSTFTSSADMMNAALELDVGDRVVITNPPTWLPPDPINLLVIGSSERYGVLERDFVINCIPESAYHVAYGESGKYARVDTAGSELSSALTSSDTSIDVTITGESVWVTAAPVLNGNGNFETDLSEWNGSGSTLTRVETPGPQPSEGSYAMKLVPDGVAEFPNGGSDQYPVTAGSDYTVSGWLRCATDRSVALNINWFDATDTYLSTSANDQAVTAGEWTYFSMTDTAPVGATTANIAPTVPDFPPSTDVLWAEDVYLRPYDADATVQNFPFHIKCGGEVLQVTSCTDAVSDTFTRAVSNGWGTADIGGSWAIFAGATADHSTSGTYAVHTNPSTGLAHISGITAPGADVDILCDIASSALATGASILGGPCARLVDNNNHYMARVEFTTGNAINLTLRERVSGTETLLDSFTSRLTHVAGTFYRVRFQAVGSVLRARIWDPATTLEPVEWQVEVTDTSLTAANNVGIRSFTNTGNTNVNPEVRIDNFRVINPQTMQVTRSVNGVTKAQSAGTDVRLTYPAVISL